MEGEDSRLVPAGKRVGNQKVSEDESLTNSSMTNTTAVQRQQQYLDGQHYLQPSLHQLQQQQLMTSQLSSLPQQQIVLQQLQQSSVHQQLSPMQQLQLQQLLHHQPHPHMHQPYPHMQPPHPSMPMQNSSMTPTDPAQQQKKSDSDKRFLAVMAFLGVN
jgi:hypothetical protein